MLMEGKKLAAIAPNVAVKVPLTEVGLRTCRALADTGTKVNVTLCFTAGQALLAAKAGASFISPFVGRLDDIGKDGMGLIEDICTIYANFDFDTEGWLCQCAAYIMSLMLPKGADVVTLPPKILSSLYKHPLTDSGLEAFIADWKQTGQSIL